jgi:beta-lactamase superfamily II metal-dependent hydrolase
MWGYLERRERTGRQAFSLVFDALSDEQAAPVRDGRLTGARLGEYLGDVRSSFVEVAIDESQQGYEVARTLEPSHWYSLPFDDGKAPSNIWGLQGDDREATAMLLRLDGVGSSPDPALGKAMTLLNVAGAANRITLSGGADPFVRAVPSALSLAVFDVGQGSCAALCDASGEIVAYFDYGGGWGPNAHTFPTPLCWHPHAQPPVLLSHWDLDHLIGFERRPEVLRSTWIAPDWGGTLGARHLKLAVRLGGNLTLVGRSPGAATGSHVVSIHFGTGTNKNDSGLVAHVSLPRTGRDNFDVLAPGDCSYQFLSPAAQSLSLDALIESHHGGNCHAKSSITPGVPRPKRSTTRAIASCGWHNSYHHPNATAFKKLQDAGWFGRRRTGMAVHGTGGFRMAGTPNPTACGTGCRQQCPRTL